MQYQATHHAILEVSGADISIYIRLELDEALETATL